MVVYLRSHRRRPIQISPHLIGGDPQGLIPRFWCCRCGKEVFEDAYLCGRCQKEDKHGKDLLRPQSL